MEYKSNSHRSKDAEKKPVERVVRGKVKTKKKSEVKRFADVFVSEDISNVKSYVVNEIVIPTIKRALSEVVTSGIDMLLYGETGVSKKRGSGGSKVSYTNYYERDRDYDRRDRRDTRDRERYSSRYRSGYDFDDIILESRGEAENVLSTMDALIEEYGVVSVSELNELVGVTGYYTDNKYGWTSLRTASVVRVRDGYMLKLPKALPLE